MVQIAVVGSGISALMAVRTLCAASVRDGGNQITWCTSRSKLATQMGPKNQTPPKPGQPYFDYGCQYLSPTSDVATKEVARWESLGLVQPIPDGQLGVFRAGGSKGKAATGYSPLLSSTSFVANGGFGPLMTSLTKQTAEEFKDVLTHVSGFPNLKNRVVGLEKKADGSWLLTKKGGDPSLGPFDIVIGAFGQHVLTDPFLLTGGEHSAAMLKCVRKIESNQIIVIQMVLKKGCSNSKFVAAHVQGDPVLSFMSNNSRKPQQSGKWGTSGDEHWTLLSTAKFAEEEFNKNSKGYRRAAEQQMLTSFAKLLQLGTLEEFQKTYQPHMNRINHWEDGLPMTTPPQSQGCLFDTDQNLGWCGDFCVAPSVDGAARSGVHMANLCLRRDEVTTAEEKASLLPTEVDWVSITKQESKDPATTNVDIGQFGHGEEKDGLLESVSTHTDLVPSAVGGYQKAKAHYGASTGGQGRGQNQGGRGSRNNRNRNKKNSTGGGGRGPGNSRGKGNSRKAPPQASGGNS